MWVCHPKKWLSLGLVAASLPLFAAWWLNTDRLMSDIAAKATANLVNTGASWAHIKFDGRDVTLTGDAPSDSAKQEVLEAISETYGVRLVEDKLRVVKLSQLQPVIKNQASAALDRRFHQYLTK